MISTNLRLNFTDAQQCRSPNHRRFSNLQLENLPKKARILVVDDVAEIRMILRFFFNRIGAEVLLAENAKEAIEIALEKSPDLILMDMQLSYIDGYIATQMLRKAGFNAPIIALTGNATEGDREKCIGAGCSDYVSKPFDHEQLLTLVTKHIKNGDRTKRKSFLKSAII